MESERESAGEVLTAVRNTGEGGLIFYRRVGGGEILCLLEKYKPRDGYRLQIIPESILVNWLYS